jgi:hypothetical protein
MNRRYYSLFVAAVATAGLIAGCGGGGSSSTTTTSSTTSSSSSTPGAGLGSGAIAAYCTAALNGAKNLSATEKSQFQSYCSSLANDNPSQIKAAEKTLCTEIVKDEAPSGEAQGIINAECSKL